MDIKVVDNFLNPKELEEIGHVVTSPNWQLRGGGGYDEGGITSLFWHIDGLENHSFFVNIFNKIRSTFNLDVNLIRCFANGQTATQSGVPHYDEGDFTFLLFTEPWKFYYGGELFFAENDEIIKTVTYKENRGVLFPSKILHYSGAPNRKYDFLRVSFAWKMLNKDKNVKEYIKRLNNLDRSE